MWIFAVVILGMLPGRPNYCLADLAYSFYLLVANLSHCFTQPDCKLCVPWKFTADCIRHWNSYCIASLFLHVTISL